MLQFFIHKTKIGKIISPFLIVVFILVLATDGSAHKKAERIKFRYEAGDGRGWGIIEKVGGNKWKEEGPLMQQYDFEEKEITAQYIELYDKTRKVRVRIYQNKHIWIIPGTKGTWEKPDGQSEKGKWIEK